MPTSKTKSPRTQFFASALEALMERNGVNQVQLAAATGIAVSRVNNYLHGRYRTIRPDHLGVLAKGAARTAAERGELARAYVQDLLPEELHEVVHLEVAGGGGKLSKETKSENRLLPSTASKALAELKALSVRSAKARMRMQWFAEILGESYRA
jgi:transcriptional regulator with XRE-family HTH domain